MTFLIIAIVILAIIYISFFINRNKKLNHLEELGGIETQFVTLLNYLTATPNARIIDKSKGKIEIVSKTSSGLHENHFTVLYTLDKISVTWNGMTYNGKRRSKTWRFPVNLDQKQMINEIKSEIYHYLI